MPFERIRKALETTSDEAVAKAADDEQLTPELRQLAKDIQKKREEGKEK